MLNQPFFQVTLPIVVSFVVTIWATQHAQNKRFDDFKENFKQFREDFKEFKIDLKEDIKRINGRLDKIEERLNSLELTKWR